MTNEIEKVVDKILHSKRALFLTGAGMSADSGIPTYRDDDGFWKNCPAYQGKKISPEILSTEHSLYEKPELVWGFYEWKRRIIAEKEPHIGYQIINRWLREIFEKGFIRTMNVDGYHLRSGCDPNMIEEIHGSIWRVQCSNRKCSQTVVQNISVPWLDLNYQTMEAFPIPKCSLCGSSLRPNVLFFGDYNYKHDFMQTQNWVQFAKHQPDLVFIIGSSSQIAVNENLAFLFQKHGSAIVTINPNSSSNEYLPADIYIALKAKDCLQKIEELLQQQRC